MEAVDLTGQCVPSAVKASRKRKAANVEWPIVAGSSKAIDLTQDDEKDAEVPKPKRKKAKAVEASDTEKRLKRYRESAPGSLRAIYDRALNQRMFCLDRQRGGDEECPTENLVIAGSTGNCYQVRIDHLPSCDCPFANKGNECKHILFALVRVLRARNYWQKAYLSSELREIFAHAPPIIPIDAEQTDSNRKPIHEGDTCPICFMEFENGQAGTVYCKIACGNNVHTECMDQWAASRKRSGAPTTCPLCRSNWFSAENPPSTVKMDTVSQREGYLNVGDQLGISTQRDYSSYHSFWVRNQARAGVDVGEYVDADPPRYRR